MTIIRHWRHLLVSLMLGCLLAASGSAMATTPKNLPAVLDALVAQGVKVIDKEAAPGGLTAYLGTLQGQPLALYVTADEKHVLVGQMFDGAGQDLTRQLLETKVMDVVNKAAWQQLENSHWVRDGNKDAPVVLYTFTDPNCPYCHRFRQAALPWIKAGKVQLRHVVVGILAKDSPAKASTILGSSNQEVALINNYNGYNKGGIKVNSKAEQKGRAAMLANNALMRSLGLTGTPSTYYHDADGNIQVKQGLPGAAAMPIMMGSPKPD